MTFPAWIEYQDLSGNVIARFSSRNSIEAAHRLLQRGLIKREGIVICAFDNEGFPIDNWEV